MVGFSETDYYLTGPPFSAHAAKVLRSASLICGWPGIGTGPQAPLPPTLIFAAILSTAPASLAYS